MKLVESVTEMLVEWNAGDESALDRLTPLVYDELRHRAAAYLRRETDADTLQATALVHEAYLQIISLRNIKWENRAHFINTIAMLMRRILVDHARERDAKKRGSGERQLPISLAKGLIDKRDVNLVILDEALNKFAIEYPRQAKVVELKFFGGLNTSEITQVLQNVGEETSLRTVERDWTFAKTWLYREMKSN